MSKDGEPATAVLVIVNELKSASHISRFLTETIARVNLLRRHFQQIPAAYVFSSEKKLRGLRFNATSISVCWFIQFQVLIGSYVTWFVI